jgi:hypothetical protein
VPVRIEVKTTPYSNNQLSWQPTYRDTLVRYAEMLKLPLLIAWRFGTFWTLIDVNRLSSPRFKISFLKAMNQALESGFLEYSFNVRPIAMPEFLATLRADGES